MSVKPEPYYFRITRDKLQNVMGSRGEESSLQISKLGGSSTVCSDLYTSADRGITANPKDMEHRRIHFGINVLHSRKPKSFWYLVWDAMQDTTLIILLVCAGVSLVLAIFMPKGESTEDHDYNMEWIEGTGILVTVLIVVLVTALNDLSKEKRFRRLQDKVEANTMCTVIRNGETKEIPIIELLVGDICLVKYGDTVPADGIILQSNDMALDESSLTGEAHHVYKDLDSNPLLFSGTNVMEGSGKMVVVAVGQYSQAGIIYQLMYQSGANEVNLTVLQMKLTHIAILIGYMGLIIAFLTVVILIVQYCLLVFAIRHERLSWTHVYHVIQIFIIGITVIVLAVPEGLPLAVTLSLAYSVMEMLKDNNLVRQLHACETVGNATTICSDKTGTLTTNQMTVSQSYIAEMLRKFTPARAGIPEVVQHKLIQGIVLNSGYTSNISKSTVHGTPPKQMGNRTDCALLGFVEELGENYRAMRERHPPERFVKVFTFNSARKSMSTIMYNPKGFRLHSKGAPEIMLMKCTYIYGRYGKLVELTDEIRKRIMRSVIEPMASSGLRTVLIAYRDFVRYGFQNEPNETVIYEDIRANSEDWIVSNLTCLAIFGIEDPVRPEVPEAIRTCQQAGITIRMITGDNINTARTIALKCGILRRGEMSLVLSSKEFNEQIRDENGEIQQFLLDAIWPSLRVLARSTPTDKYVLVKGIIESEINESREVVAVTGDGTNDAPALKTADVGFAMGITGTDVAKQASDIIVMDDNFTSIVNAVMWGRNVYDNITKFLQFQLTANVVAVVLAFVGACTVRTSVLRAVQILWVNLVMDTLASLALATEPPNRDLLKRKPYGRTKSLISGIMIRNIIGQAIYQLIVVFLILYAGSYFTSIPMYERSSVPTKHHTFVFNAFVIMTLFNEISCRKVNGERKFYKGIFKNWLFISIWISKFIAQVLIVEFGSFVFWTAPLPWDIWLWSLGFGLGTLVWQQIILFIPEREGIEELSFLELEDMNLEAEFLAESYFPEFKKSPKNLVLWLRGLARYETQTRQSVTRGSRVDGSRNTRLTAATFN